MNLWGKIEQAGSYFSQSTLTLQENSKSKNFFETLLVRFVSKLEQ